MQTRNESIVRFTHVIFDCITEPEPDLSLEFLMGRALDNAMLNVGLKDVARGIFQAIHTSKNPGNADDPVQLV